MVATGACTPVGGSSIGESLTFIPTAFATPPEAERTLTFGYSAINERYLDRVPIAEAALEGIRGFSRIDDTLAADRQGDKVVLTAGRQAVARYAAAADNDAAGWARLTLAAITDARRTSDKMHQASEDEVLEAVFDATLAHLDPFSRYAAPSEARNNRANRNGFAGIGVRYDKIGPQGVEITEVISESPASEAGLHDGDILTQIDGAAVTRMEIERVSEMLRGDIGSRVTLTVVRKDSRRSETVAVRRDLVIPPTVAMTLDDGIANIKISGFNQKTASSLKQAVREARAALGGRLNGVLLDLRGNPGGLLDQAVAMADLFMAHGRIVSTAGRHRHASQSYDASPGDLAEDLPLVLLVDGRSASASEILAAALQDSGRAVVIGTNSYGKGTVQTVIRMPNDGEMTLTWSRFHSPTGYALHGLGVLPTICTSDGTAKVDGMITAISAGGSPVAANLALWRASAIEQKDLRKQLRATCPSERHGYDPEESELAENLLRDRQLYARVLAVSLPSGGDTTTGAGRAGHASTTEAAIQAH